MNTTYEDVIDSFHGTFQDKVAVPESLELQWFKKAVGTYSYKLSELKYDTTKGEFDDELDQYIVDSLGAMMKHFYQERELSKVNKRISIVGKDLSIDGSNASKPAARLETEMAKKTVGEMIHDQMTTAYN